MWASSPTINRLYFCYCVCIFSKTTPQSPSVTGLACRLGRGFCFTKVSPGHPHPLTRWAFPDHIIDYIIMVIWSVLFNPPVTISSWQPPLSKRGLSQTFYLINTPICSIRYLQTINSASPRQSCRRSNPVLSNKKPLRIELPHIEQTAQKRHS